MVRSRKLIIQFPVFLLCLGCASSTMRSFDVKLPSHQVEKVAVNLHKSILAEMIEVELVHQGFDVVGTLEMIHLLRRLCMNDVNVNDPVSLTQLQKENIDLYLVSKRIQIGISRMGYGSQAEKASFDVYSTRTGDKLMSLDWGWQRSDDVILAREIVKELTKQLGLSSKNWVKP